MYSHTLTHKAEMKLADKRGFEWMGIQNGECNIPDDEDRKRDGVNREER